MAYDLSILPDVEIEQILEIGLPDDLGLSPENIESGMFYHAAEDERARRIKSGSWTRPLMRLLLGA